MNIYADIATKKMTETNGRNFLPAAEHPVFFLDTEDVLDLHLMSGGSPLVLTETDTFTASLDKDFVHGSDELMAYSADCTIVDAAAGHVRITMLFTADAYETKLAGEASVSAYLEVKRLQVGKTTPSIVLQDTVTAKNCVQVDEGAPATADPDFYSAAQVDSLLSQLLATVSPVDFTTTAETGETVTFTAETLGVDHGACDFELIQVVSETVSKTMTTSSLVDREWTAAGYVVTWHGGWPAGSWQLKAGRVRGLAGRDSEDYDPVDVVDNSITVSRVPQEFYWTAVSGITLSIDWSAVASLDKVIPLIITMPDPIVSFAWPPGITWLEGAAPNMSTPGEYHVALKKYRNGVLGNLCAEV